MDRILKTPKSPPHMEYDYGLRVNILEDGEGAPGKTYNLDCVAQQNFEESVHECCPPAYPGIDAYGYRVEGCEFIKERVTGNVCQEEKNKTCKSVHKTEPTATTTPPSPWIPVEVHGMTFNMYRPKPMKGHLFPKSNWRLKDRGGPLSDKMLAKEEKNKTCKSVHKTEPTATTITTPLARRWIHTEAHGKTCYISAPKPTPERMWPDFPQIFSLPTNDGVNTISKGGSGGGSGLKKHTASRQQ